MPLSKGGIFFQTFLVGLLNHLPYCSQNTAFTTQKTKIMGYLYFFELPVFTNYQELPIFQNDRDGARSSMMWGTICTHN